MDHRQLVLMDKNPRIYLIYVSASRINRAEINM